MCNTFACCLSQLFRWLYHLVLLKYTLHWPRPNQLAVVCTWAPCSCKSCCVTFNGYSQFTAQPHIAYHDAEWLGLAAGLNPYSHVSQSLLIHFPADHTTDNSNQPQLSSAVARNLLTSWKTCNEYHLATNHHSINDVNNLFTNCYKLHDNVQCVLVEVFCHLSPLNHSNGLEKTITQVVLFLFFKEVGF